MLLGNFKSKIGNNIFQLRKNFEIFSKMKKKLIFHKISKKNSIYNLLNNGYEIQENLLNSDDINFISNKYLFSNNINDDKVYQQNLTFPFFDKIIIEKVFNSEIFRKTKIFFKSIYNVDPVLQQSPLIVITKPSFDKNEMNTSYKIPADYHTDYPTEVALHIPLNDLKEGVIHTVYCKSSNRNIFIKSTSKYSENFTNKFKKINLVSKKGAGILLDTQGIHKANVKKGNIRIMLFFKFSSKNNIIKNVDYTKSSFSAKKSNYFRFDKEKLMIDKNYSAVLGLKKEQIEIFDYFMI
jgi:hypothetical protein